MENERTIEMMENDCQPPVGEDIPADTDLEDTEQTLIPEEAEKESASLPDYAKMAEEDLLLVRRLCPRFAGLESLSELPSVSRFGELREMGLSVPEALGALGLSGAEHDTRAHLRTSVPRRLGDSGVRMTPSELEGAKRLFPNLSEREITGLYRRVCK